MALDVRQEITRWMRTARWSFQGLAAAWSGEKSFRQWVVVNILSAGLAFALDLTAGERALILALGLLVLVAELFNTAIEEIVDMVSPDPHPSAGKAKDCASAAVMVVAIAGALAWLVLLLG